MATSETLQDKYKNTKMIIPACIFGFIGIMTIYALAMTAIDPSYCQPITDKVCVQKVSDMKLMVKQLCFIVFTLQIGCALIVVVGDLLRNEEVKKDVIKRSAI